MSLAFTGLMLRFWMGAAGVLAAGLLVFRSRLFQLGDPAFQCLTVGLLAAGVLALIRGERPLQALTLAAAFGLFRLGLIEQIGWVAAVSGFVLGAGVFVSAMIFDLLVHHGLRFGKFLILGPLLGGVFLAAAPMAEFQFLAPVGSPRTLMTYIFIGIVVGNGTGLGVEAADAIHAALERSQEGLAGESR